MKVKKLAHIAINVKDMDDTVSLLGDIFDLKLESAHKLDEVRENTFLSPSSSIELRYRPNESEGVHHIGLEVENIEDILSGMKEKGMKPMEEKPRLSKFHPGKRLGG